MQVRIIQHILHKNETMRTCGQIALPVIAWEKGKLKCFQPITMSIQAKPYQTWITFDTQLKIVLTYIVTPGIFGPSDHTYVEPQNA